MAIERIEDFRLDRLWIDSVPQRVEIVNLPVDYISERFILKYIY